MKTILVLQRGWIAVGDLTDENEQRVKLTGASIIRRWGTTKGLGQLALEGPQSGTVLDACGSVEVHPLAIVLRLPCEAAKWS